MLTIRTENLLFECRTDDEIEAAMLTASAFGETILHVGAA